MRSWFRPAEAPNHAIAGASLSTATGPVKSTIVRFGMRTTGAPGTGPVVQPSQIAAYPISGVVVCPARVASAARSESGAGSPVSPIRTYASKPGGPYRTRSIQSTPVPISHDAGSASTAGTTDT